MKYRYGYSRLYNGEAPWQSYIIVRADSPGLKSPLHGRNPKRFFLPLFHAFTSFSLSLSLRFSSFNPFIRSLTLFFFFLQSELIFFFYTDFSFSFPFFFLILILARNKVIENNGSSEENILIKIVRSKG